MQAGCRRQKTMKCECRRRRYTIDEDWGTKGLCAQQKLVKAIEAEAEATGREMSETRTKISKSQIEAAGWSLAEKKLKWKLRLQIGQETIIQGRKAEGKGMRKLDRIQIQARRQRLWIAARKGKSTLMRNASNIYWYDSSMEILIFGGKVDAKSYWNRQVTDWFTNSPTASFGHLQIGRGNTYLEVVTNKGIIAYEKWECWRERNEWERDANLRIQRWRERGSEKVNGMRSALVIDNNK